MYFNVERGLIHCILAKMAIDLKKGVMYSVSEVNPYV